MFKNPVYGEAINRGSYLQDWSVEQVRQRIRNLDRLELVGLAKTGQVVDLRSRARKALLVQKPKHLQMVKAGR